MTIHTLPSAVVLALIAIGGAAEATNAAAAQASGCATGCSPGSPLAAGRYVTVRGAAVTYEFTRLATLGGTQGEANGINNRGEIVGGTTTVSGETHAVIWHDGALHDLGVGVGEASGVNNKGEVVGGGAGGPFLWRYGVIQWLPKIFAPDSAVALGINDHGLIVGGESTQAVIWTRSTVTIVYPPNGYYDDILYGVNDLGEAVGCSVLVPGPQTSGVLYRRSGDLDLLSAYGFGGLGSCTRAINNHGQSVGSSWPTWNAPYEGQKATRWDHLTPIALDSPEDSSGSAINDDGLVVGWMFKGSQPNMTHAILWVGTAFTDLNAFIDPDLKAAGWVMTNATGINNQGWIVGFMSNWSTGESSGWVLKPKPAEAP
jgi:probable HAF family extracellular repeat protein